MALANLGIWFIYSFYRLLNNNNNNNNDNNNDSIDFTSKYI